MSTRSSSCRPRSTRRESGSHRETEARRQGLLIELVDCAAANDGAEDARFGELGWRKFGEVVRKDDEVGVQHYSNGR